MVAASAMVQPVHPHTRGDICRSPVCRRVQTRFTPTRVGTSARPLAVPTSRCGSPPHAWGHLVAIVETASYIHRFTPTRVGTSAIDGDHGRSAVHPHTRGDIALFGREQVERVVGSPPHAWGHRRISIIAQPSPIRFTPTRVGTSRTVLSTHRPEAVHPHTRGDICGHARRPRYCPVHPHTRGDIAPATTIADMGRTVHPHTRGDIGVTCQRLGCIPVHPHTRGDICMGNRGRPDISERFTPTRVGTLSLIRFLPGPRPGSPPHAWGHRRSRSMQAARGSPPHAWGHRSARLGRRRAARFTPHTRGDIFQCRPMSRSLGASRFTPTRVGTSDGIASHGNSAVACGSPPHAWGHLPDPAPREASGRFTPTRVGTSAHRTFCGHAALAVHPHTRGDIPRNAHPAPVRRTRFTPTRVGTLSIHRKPSPVDAERFTPTRVGTLRRPPKSPRGEPTTVHPHTRGDTRDPRKRCCTSTIRFTPTRVGTLDVPRCLNAEPDRFTPTRVGTLIRRSGESISCADPVHPHTRGDISFTDADGSLDRAGSPPHAWGH